MAPRHDALSGAVIENVDLSKPLSDDNRQALRQALVDHGVSFFREQTLTPEQHVALARTQRRSATDPLRAVDGTQARAAVS
ncbi:Alpha-ketoglutarate-dependent taurine dioxygenase (plasmid) [Paraburkholderia caribensis MBA4]|uniref:Alpha-ketoglutarate-dependent taurine dioxygenase n=1 Tax=Paraburkholderia caribensis MBA4 TaxID=1323664 RepID=A0A0P0RMR0_9BURK|nr:Alpha-ketoglutarate-dependent taurine dioxygenase [Paraburkholderia caribensis MBA4]